MSCGIPGVGPVACAGDIKEGGVECRDYAFLVMAEAMRGRGAGEAARAVIGAAGGSDRG